MPKFELPTDAGEPIYLMDNLQLHNLLHFHETKIAELTDAASALFSEALRHEKWKRMLQHIIEKEEGGKS
jgi:hypothetical protein